MSEQLYREATDRERKDHPDVEMLAVLPVERDYEVGLAAASDHSHGWIDKDEDTLESFTVGVDAALKGNTDE